MKRKVLIGRTCWYGFGIYFGVIQGNDGVSNLLIGGAAVELVLSVLLALFVFQIDPKTQKRVAEKLAERTPAVCRAANVFDALCIGIFVWFGWLGTAFTVAFINLLNAFWMTVIKNSNGGAR